MVGLLLAERIQGREHPYFTALQHDTPSTLPEPLQWMAVKTMLGAAHWMDERTNSKVRRASPVNEHYQRA
jgi:hypothetical protein